jgi:hypothetical protein
MKLDIDIKHCRKGTHDVLHRSQLQLDRKFQLERGANMLTRIKVIVENMPSNVIRYTNIPG